MLHKYSEAKVDPTSDVRLGEIEAQAVFCEAMDLYKVSAAVDPDVPLFLERIVDQRAMMHVHAPLELRPGTELERKLDKLSSSPGFIPAFLARKEQQAAVSEKTSVVGDFFSGLMGGPEYDSRRIAAGYGQGPVASGPATPSDPVFDVTRGLRRVGDDSRDALRYTALTPEQRIGQGVYFDADLPHMARTRKLAPRSLREAVLLGAHEGVRKANEDPPGMIDRVKFWLAQRNARNLGHKAQRQRIHGRFPGTLGVLEESLPDNGTRIREWAGNAGSKLRHLPPAAKLALGVTAGGAGLLGVRALSSRPNHIEILRRQAEEGA
jgi:hypothetical protein